MHIHVDKRTVYGVPRRYIRDSRLALAVQMLTGRATLSESDVTALVQLGVTFSESEEK